MTRVETKNVKSQGHSKDHKFFVSHKFFSFQSCSDPSENPLQSGQHT